MNSTLAPDDLQKWITPAHPVMPNLERKAMYDWLYPLYRELYTSTRNVVHRLSG